YFPADRGAPPQIQLLKLVPWNDYPEDGVKYFSGTAAYAKTIDLSGELIGDGKKIYLDLGVVKNLAEVSLNGKDLGILWKPPFRLDLTPAAQAGRNQLIVKVTNLWPNRLIGDAKLPESKRITWSAYDAYKADAPLLQSGLLGPVRILATREVTPK